MDPISVIVAALAAGAGAGLKDTASDAVKDSYGVLRKLVRGRLGGRSVAQTVLAEHEKAPHVWEAPLSAELVAAGADSDQKILAAAQRLLALVDQAGTQSGKYLVSVRESEGVQIGDHSIQTNTWS